MKLYTLVIHYLQMCMKEYHCCPKFGRGDNLTYTLKYVLYGEVGLYAQLLLNGSLDLNEALHSCNTLPADVHEGIWFEHHCIASGGYHSVRSLTVLVFL
jgi:hypothetical protein